MVPSADAVSFVDDQDTELDGGALYYADGADYVLANVFMLAWDYGTPMVLSDYAFSSYDQGPPSAGRHLLRRDQRRRRGRGVHRHRGGSERGGPGHGDHARDGSSGHRRERDGHGTGIWDMA
jgi:hypothetical protein